MRREAIASVAPLRSVGGVASYGRASDPGLVVQLRPTDPAITLDLEDAGVLARLSAGAPSQRGWWGQFKAEARNKPTLHGVAILPSWADRPQWALEGHRDGHFIAGVWDFPTVDNTGDAASRALPAFFGKMLEDFFHVVANVMTPAHQAVKFNATATICGTDVLSFMTKSDFGDQWARARGPLQRQVTQLPIYGAQLGVSTWQGVAVDLARAMCGACGCTYRV
jgi:hypothetical protein